MIDFSFEDRLGIPKTKINVDDYLTLYDGEVKNSLTFDFDCTAGDHELRITHYGKTKHQAACIDYDKHMEITAIIMDDVPLEQELWMGKFYPVYLHPSDNEPTYIQPNLYLGHNGTWVLPFRYPCLNWLIDLRKAGPDIKDTIFSTSDKKLIQAIEFFKGVDDV